MNDSSSNPASMSSEIPNEPVNKQADSTKPFSLPRRITVHVSPKALYITLDKQQSSSKSLVRIEWSSQPSLVFIQDQQTIQDELGVTPILKIDFDGLVGLIQLFKDSYLIFISSHTTAGYFNHKKVYRIERVIALPLVYSKALELLTSELSKRRSKLEKLSLSTSASSTIAFDSNSDLASDITDEEILPPEADEDLPPSCITSSTPPSSSSSLSSSVDEGFQRVADPHKINISELLWKRKKDKAVPVDHQTPQKASHTTTNTLNNVEESDQDNLNARLSLDQKFINVLCNELTRGGMFYALDWDITHSFQAKHDMCSNNNLNSSTNIQEPRVAEPLHKRAQQTFWWNRWMLQPFLRSGFDNLGYVIMQGFIESTQFEISNPKQEHSSNAPEKATEEMNYERKASISKQGKDTSKIEIGLISRRSILRPGLRYQRRGIDLNGSVANFVETECVLTHPSSCKTQGESVLWSSVQVRGSVPLFWGQNPSALKPPIVLEGSHLENLDAMKKHFLKLMKAYGDILVICLAEKTGNESKLVDAFESKFEALNKEIFDSSFQKDQHLINDHDLINQSTENTSHEGRLKFISWDFHHQCKGMHYENVNKLMDDIQDVIDRFGYFSNVGNRQKGVMRSNCIDCLDRTNVIQSAIAKQILNRFLADQFNFQVDSKDSQHRLDDSFNSLWANNGDQISKQYAGTSALKGDFVRTGRRNWRGVVNDATNSIARMWHNSILDFFKQSVLDYALGINITNFSQFQESYSSFHDPSELIRYSKIRRIAIDQATEQVLPEEESKIDGWNFLTPNEPGLIQSISYGLDERILILSSKALYIISYEYLLSKVQGFLRIGLEDIIEIQIGVYITATTDERERDPQNNYGFVISYDTAGAIEKKSTYSMQSEASPASLEGETVENSANEADEKSTPATIKQIAFKALQGLTTSSLEPHASQVEPEEPVGLNGSLVRISAQEFVHQVVNKVELQSNQNQIIFIDSKNGDEHSEPFNGNHAKSRKVVLIHHSPIISLSESLSLSSASQHNQFNGLLSKMTKGVKQIMG